MRAIVAGLPDQVLNWHPAPGEWCIKEVLGHLIEAERHDFAGRIRLIVESHQEPHLPRTDQVALAHTRRDCEQRIGDLLREVEESHEASLALVAGLGSEVLREGGYHPVIGYLHIFDLLHEWVYHQSNHLRQALANVEAFG